MEAARQLAEAEELFRKEEEEWKKGSAYREDALYLQSQSRQTSPELSGFLEEDATAASRWSSRSSPGGLEQFDDTEDFISARPHSGKAPRVMLSASQPGTSAGDTTIMRPKTTSSHRYAL